MVEPQVPAWSRESAAVRLDGAIHLADLTPGWAWGGSSGLGVRVAVVDSGIEADHPGLDGCVDVEGGVAVRPDHDGRLTLVPGPHADDFGHGTACAGIVHSLAPDARITSVKVLGGNLGGTSEAFLMGLNWAVEERFDVINLSLGTRKRDWALAFYEVCDLAYFQGSFLVTAANNVQRDSFPSLYASVTSVACNTAKDPFRFHFNPDPPTEFLARGIDVDVAWRGGGRLLGTGNSLPRRPTSRGSPPSSSPNTRSCARSSSRPSCGRRQQTSERLRRWRAGSAASATRSAAPLGWPPPHGDDPADRPPSARQSRGRAGVLPHPTRAGPDWPGQRRSPLANDSGDHVSNPKPVTSSSSSVSLSAHRMPGAINAPSTARSSGFSVCVENSCNLASAVVTESSLIPRWSANEPFGYTSMTTDSRGSPASAASGARNRLAGPARWTNLEGGK